MTNLNLTQLTNKTYIRNYLKNNNLFLRKKLGQNFLICPESIKTLVEQLELTPQDIIIEIGPGLGTVTCELIKRVTKLIAIELDRKLAMLLKENFSQFNNLDVLHHDAMKIDFQNLIAEIQNNIPGKRGIKIFSNLPYNIATSFIIKLLEKNFPIERMVFTIQKELMERFTATPKNKNYAASSVILQSSVDITFIKNISKEKFFPVPKVESSIILLQANYILKNNNILNKVSFFNFIKNSFAHKRKTLYNSLFISSTFDEQKLKTALQSCKIDIRTRAEELSLEVLIQLYKILYR